MALGIVYFHFGMLKFFPDLSPAELLATQTIMAVSFNWLDAHDALFVLAVMETALGLALLLDVFPKTTFTVFMFHMLGTFAPLVVLPEFAFKIAPFAPSIEGQYILKNLVFVAAGWTVLYPSAFPARRVAQRTDVPASPPAPPKVASEPTPATATIAQAADLDPVGALLALKPR
ncbi:MAG: hypothetical protein KDA61_09465 [Planctomycetales bacterium]|nr:hypothetical protein [Planctomycetales bacterium]